ncbi:UDP-2,3-diacylglucosamine diphosphatase [Tautonia sp. JC769]|uniref:UDP-2,3-diacylglucosamine diphosphatase n=1 Tax=Tautonia sp. JC769 TaxID=3232135 RepID=UPI003459DC39
MADYFVSDVHLRLDHVERSERFAAFVRSLSPADSLTVVGDLCDFWFSSRQRHDAPLRCPGLHALAEFRRQGGMLLILPGNHDAWLAPFYEKSLGARCVDRPWEGTRHGVKISAVHGHRLGARKPWKAMMESRPFLSAFEAIPGPIARRLADRLERSNAQSLAATHHRHLMTYRAHARRTIEGGRAHLVLLGHVHDVFDEAIGPGRMIVLGDWMGGSSHVRVDAQGVHFVADRPLATTLNPAIRASDPAQPNVLRSHG